MRHLMLYSVLAALVMTIPALGGDWEYDTAPTEELLYLHPLINYALDPDWERSWERQALSTNGIRLSIGSISKSQFLHNETIAINADLGSGWWFRGLLDWNGSRHRDIDSSSQYLGFQRKVFGGLFISAMGDFRHDKEEVDAAFGLLFLNGRDQEEYVWIDAVWDDIAFDQRTQSRGRTERRPVGVRWRIRQEQGPFAFISSGTYSNGFSRYYPFPEYSGGLTGHDRTLNDTAATLVWRFDQVKRVEGEFETYRFDEAKRYSTAENGYAYRNEYYHGLIRYIRPWGVIDQIRIELHMVSQRSWAHGVRDFRFNRTDFMPALFMKHRFSRHTISGGYMGSALGWDMDDRLFPERSTDHDAYIDKVMLGWTYHFTNSAAFRASLSHVVSISRFGGGAGQFIMFF